MATRPDDIKERIIGGIAVVRLFRKDDGDLLAKLMTFVLQLAFMASLTFYAAANSSVVDSVGLGTPAGGIMFLYALTIGASWVILLILLQLVDDKNILVAGKISLMTVLLILLVVVFFCVLIGGIVAAGAAVIGAGVLIGYCILTWLFTELLQAVAVVVAFKLAKKPRPVADELDDDDEYSESRGTFQGVDEAAALSPQKAATEGVAEEDPAAVAAPGAGDEEDDDLGLL